MLGPRWAQNQIFRGPWAVSRCVPKPYRAHRACDVVTITMLTWQALFQQKQLGKETFKLWKKLVDLEAACLESCPRSCWCFTGDRRSQLSLCVLSTLLYFWPTLGFPHLQPKQSCSVDGVFLEVWKFRILSIGPAPNWKLYPSGKLKDGVPRCQQSGDFCKDSWLWDVDWGKAVHGEYRVSLWLSVRSGGVHFHVA